MTCNEKFNELILNHDDIQKQMPDFISESVPFVIL